MAPFIAHAILSGCFRRRVFSLFFLKALLQSPPVNPSLSPSIFEPPTNLIEGLAPLPDYLT